MSRPVLLDTDIGSDVDDVLALGLLLASPELAPVAVTTVAREAPRRARLAAGLVELARRKDVDVCAGVSDAVLRLDRSAWGRNEEAMQARGPLAEASVEPAAERIVRATQEVPDLEVVAIGPLTNLAHALARDPELPRRVAGLTIMGGHIREVRIGDHLCRPGIDYNLCSDPEAAVAVLGAGFRTTLVSADVTLQVWMRESDRERLAAAGPLARALADHVRIWTPTQREIFTGLGGTLAPDNAAFLHDPLTVWSLVDPSPLRFEDLHIVPTIQDGVLRTLEVDPASGLGAPMRVATAVDAEAARDAILERLLRL